MVCVLGSKRVIIILLAGPLCFQMQIAPPQNYIYIRSVNKQEPKSFFCAVWLLQEERFYIYIVNDGAGQVDGNVSRGDDTNLLRLMRNLCMLR